MNNTRTSEDYEAGSRHIQRHTRQARESSGGAHVQELQRASPLRRPAVAAVQVPQQRGGVAA
jgi:hypothetical protein